ncbi:thioredoxin-like protein [Spinellus fusiger]|nr:thioredoxin-like protein [Spinellus fusiger]
MVATSLLWTAVAATFAALTHTVLAEGNVVTLGSGNFTQVLNEDLALVKFYAPWCGHCKTLAPEYESAAGVLKEQNIALFDVDCTVNQELCQEYKVAGYPTLKLFSKGTHVDYKGPRQSEGIVNYMKRRSLPAVSILSPENFESFKSSDRVVVVGYADADDEASRATFTDVAESLRDEFAFSLVTDKTLIKDQKIKSLPSVVVYKQFDEGRDDLESDFNKESIQSFVKASSVPLMDEIDGNNFKTYVDAGLPLAYLFSDNVDTLKPMVESLTPLAKKFKGKVNFVHINATVHAMHAQNLALKETWPAFAIQRLDTGAKYPYDQTKTITADNIEKFVGDYLDGKITATLKSEPVPADNNGPVKVVVGEEYDAIVRDTTKDVFLEIYAPWCGHCKALAPVWEAIGKAVKEQGSEDSLVIAKLDGTENDLPEDSGIQITGFPTLKLVKAGTNEVIEYEGDRSLPDLIRFIKENTAKSVELNADTIVVETPPPEPKYEMEIKDEDIRAFVEKEEKEKAEKEAKEKAEKEAAGHDEL